MLGNFALFLVCSFFKLTVSNISLSNNRVSYSLDPDQARHYVGPNLGPNCLQRILADDASEQKVN